MRLTNEERVQKYDGMLEQAVKAVQDGTVKPFPGFPEAIHFNLVVAMKLAMHPRLQFGVFEHLKQVSPGTVRPFLLADVDYALHMTVQQVRGEKVGKLPSVAIPNFDVGQLVFDRIILDPGGTLMMVATAEPEWLVRTRTGIEEAAVAAGWKPDDLSIVHVALARILQPFVFPQRYLDLAEAWNASLEADPLVFSPTQDDVYVGSSGDLMGLPKE